MNGADADPPTRPILALVPNRHKSTGIDLAAGRIDLDAPSVTLFSGIECKGVSLQIYARVIGLHQQSASTRLGSLIEKKLNAGDVGSHLVLKVHKNSAPAFTRQVAPKLTLNNFYGFSRIATAALARSEEHTSELQSRGHLV